MIKVIALVMMYLLLVLCWVIPSIRKHYSIIQYRDELLFFQAGLIIFLMIASIFFVTKNWSNKRLVLCVFPLVIYSAFASVSFVIFYLAILGVIPLR
ncbi:hypothetical protein B9G39_08425 [Zooshikella ganghwensis]|uniref:Uncharacterized protein n=1 Tax=Zooshikella ganghwensis TaxID=202772 RepID=A0A4P9VMY0_9GAMM|nr:hypothetical protein B9G39_08425 [Zooshikella ganghwensis]